jgi:hypothetical protein
MRKLLTGAGIMGALASTGCASYVAAPPPPAVYVAPRPAVVAPAPVVVAPAPVVVGPVCGWRTVQVVRPSGRVVFRRVRVCR